MRLCIPTLDDRREKGHVSEHFGSAPYFTLVDSATGDIEVLENRHSHHEHGACEPATILRDHSVDAVICPGLGRRAFARLSDAGIVVYVSRDRIVSRAVEAFQTGGLRRLTSEEACHGGRGHRDAH